MFYDDAFKIKAVYENKKEKDASYDIHSGIFALWKGGTMRVGWQTRALMHFRLSREGAYAIVFRIY